MQHDAILKPIRRRKVYQEVAHRLEGMIADGQFAPGDPFLSEREIMDAFDVGRSAVREAMLSLERSGLIRVRSGERAQVTRPTAKMMVRELSTAARLLLSEDGGIVHFQEARTLLETGLARRAAMMATDEDIERLRRALEANRDSIGDYEGFKRTDVAFHYALAAIAKNPIFLSFNDAMAEWLTEQRAISGQVKDAFEIAYNAHARIFQAIAARDPESAQTAMEEHMSTVVQNYWKARSETADKATGDS